LGKSGWCGEGRDRPTAHIDAGSSKKSGGEKTTAPILEEKKKSRSGRVKREKTQRGEKGGWD